VVRDPSQARACRSLARDSGAVRVAGGLAACGANVSPSGSLVRYAIVCVVCSLACIPNPSLVWIRDRLWLACIPGCSSCFGSIRDRRYVSRIHPQPQPRVDSRLPLARMLPQVRFNLWVNSRGYREVTPLMQAMQPIADPCAIQHSAPACYSLCFACGHP
jgi:hypothetical protein